MKLKYLFLYGLLLILASCSLDYKPVGSYSELTEGIDSAGAAVFLKDKAAVLSQRQDLYDRVRAGQEYWYLDVLLLAESHSDNAYAGSPGAETTPFEVNSIEGSNPNLKRDWSGYMDNVSSANILITYIDSVKDATLTTAERAQYKAEGKIFRALVYFDMARIWGNVPLITSAVATNITSANIAELYPTLFPSQSDEKTVYQQIEKDLLDALVAAPDNNPSDKTVFSKSVARALLAKVYAEKPLQDYDKVIQYCDALTADGFGLVDNFSDLFGVVLQNPNSPPGANNLAIDAKARNTKESILEAQYISGDKNWATWMFGRQLDDWNYYFTWAKWITPSRDLIAAFNSEGDTKRFNESVVYYPCDWGIYYPKDNYAFMYKCRSGYNSIIRYRYADVLLLKAEALILGKGDLNGAAAIINQIRTRAGLAALSASVVGNKDAMANALLKERRLELAFEGQRWFDLVRLGKVESVLNNLKDSGRPPLVYPYNQYSYKLPVPQDILDQNPNLVQNPGY